MVENLEKRILDSKDKWTPKEAMKVMSSELIMKALIRGLKKKGIEAKVFKKAVSGSCYMHFKDQRMGKCRIGDHNERSRYGYRWQIRADISNPFEDSSKGHRQFYYPFTGVSDAIERMTRYYNTINGRKV